MCLSDNELTALFCAVGLQMAFACLVFTIPDRRARVRLHPGNLKTLLFRSLLYTIPAAALIKLAHDWIGSGGPTVCVSRLAFLVGSFLLCAALEFGTFVHKQAEPQPNTELELHLKYPVRLWALYILFGAIMLTLTSFIRFK